MSHSKNAKYDELSCLVMQSGKVKYIGLVDGGSNVSIVCQRIVDKLGLKDKIIKDRQTVKSFNGACSTIEGKVNINFKIGNLKFEHQFLIQKALSTGTQAILGIDFLKKSEAHVKYDLDGVKLTLLDIQNVPLVEAQKREYAGNTLKVLTLQTTPSTKRQFVKAAENKKN